jgi:hypothetical protein
VLAPFAAVTPSGVDTRSVSAVHEVTAVAHERTNASARPPGFGAVAPRFLALDTNDTKSPADAMDGLELAPLPGVVPSGVETRKVVGTQVVLATPLQVSRTKTCGVIPSNVALDTRFVASETNATKRESGLITGLKLSPFPGLTPSALMDTNCVETVDPVVTMRQKTWRVIPVSAADVTRFVAVEVNATVEPPESIVGSELAPLAEFPLTSVVTSVVVGVQEAFPKQVVRTNTSLAAFVSFFTRLFEIAANATALAVLLVEGPAVAVSGVPVAHIDVVPQIPFAACDPSGARSRITGSPSDVVGLTANSAIFEVPPPGAELNT